MSDVTKYILSKTNRLTPEQEEVTEPPGYQMFNSGGVEIEVAEFLYSLVRMLKPQKIIETGTHLGISSTYMARALQVNDKGGRVTTFEVIPELLGSSQKLWADVGVSDYVQGILLPSLDVEFASGGATTVDMLFLDSEPQFRFDEFIKFFPFLKPGGLVIIHDLHPSMGHHGQTYHGVYDWPYGDWRPKLGQYLKDNKVQTFHFQTPRGVTIFQKALPEAETTKYLAE